MASIPKAQAVETVKAGGCVREGVQVKRISGNRELVPVLRLYDSGENEVGTITSAVLGHLLGKNVIRRSHTHGQTIVYVKAG